MGNRVRTGNGCRTAGVNPVERGRSGFRLTPTLLFCALAVSGLFASSGWGHTNATLPVDACTEPTNLSVWPQRYLNFETPQCNPIALSRRGRIYVVNTPRHEIVEMTRSGRIKRRLYVGLEPSGVAASPDGRTLYVTNHLSDNISVVDVKKWVVKATIEDVDPATRLSVLDEPCGVVFSPVQPRAFVTLSQPNQVAVIDTTTHSVLDLIDIDGEDPRALAVSPDGRYVFVAAFASGNQTEVDVVGEEIFYEAPGSWWQNFIALIVQAIRDFPFTGRISLPTPGANLAERPDSDVFVIDTSTLEVTRIDGVGTLLYGLEFSSDGNTVWVANTNHENFKNGFAEIDGRPIANRLTRIRPGTGGWSDAEIAFFAMDEDPSSGNAVAGGAVPAAIVRTKRGDLLVPASSSDTLIILDGDGTVRARVGVGSMPRGVVTRGNLAWTYNRGDSTVSIVHVKKAKERKRVSFGQDPAPANLEAGRRHFYSAEFSRSRTFSCASCHPDSDTDHLIWEFDDVTGHRGTQTVRGIAGTEGFHWDGSQADAHELIVGGVTGPIFQGSINPCQVNQMAEFILNVPFPPSPYRSPSDMLTPEARVGAAVARRGVHYDDQDIALSPLAFDPGFESLFKSIAGENILPGIGETCAASGCHTAPLWTSPGVVGGIEAVTFRGMWDRNTWVHNGVSSKVGELEATDLYRADKGYPPRYAGVATADASSSSFMTTFFRGHDSAGQPGADPLALNERVEAFMRELSTGLPGVLGRQVLFDGTPTAEEGIMLTEILDAADDGKITMRIHGTTATGSVHWFFVPGAPPTFVSEDGQILTPDEVEAILATGPYLLLVTADLPTHTDVQPLLRTIVTLGAPGVIATAQNGKTQTFEIRGSGFVPGMWLLVDGFPYVQPAVLSDSVARHTESPVNAPASFYVLSLLNPAGLQSNEFPMPVVGDPDPTKPPTFEPASSSAGELLGSG